MKNVKLIYEIPSPRHMCGLPFRVQKIKGEHSLYLKDINKSTTYTKEELETMLTILKNGEIHTDLTKSI